MAQGSTTGSNALDQHSVLVEAWACGLCARVHAEKAAADDCCKCSVCGTKFLHEAHYQTTCDTCQYGSSLREARKSVGRAEVDLKNCRERLENLVNNPPAGKRRPKKVA